MRFLDCQIEPSPVTHLQKSKSAPEDATRTPKTLKNAATDDRHQPYLSHQTGLVLSPATSIIATSDAFNLPYFHASIVSHDSDETFNIQDNIHDLWIMIPLISVKLAIRAGDDEQQVVLSTDTPSIVAPASALETKITGHTRILHVFIKAELLSWVANDLYTHQIDTSLIKSQFNSADDSMIWLRGALCDILCEPPEDAALALHYLSRLFTTHILRKHIGETCKKDKEPEPRLSRDQARLIVTYIQDHLSSRILLSDLTALVGINETRFMRRFRASFRQSPRQYIIQARVDLARKLLETSNLSLQRIGDICGFADQPHFSTTFRQSVGVTAARYRQIMCSALQEQICDQIAPPMKIPNVASPSISGASREEA